MITFQPRHGDIRSRASATLKGPTISRTFIPPAAFRPGLFRLHRLRKLGYRLVFLLLVNRSRGLLRLSFDLLIEKFDRLGCILITKIMSGANMRGVDQR